MQPSEKRNLSFLGYEPFTFVHSKVFGDSLMHLHFRAEVHRICPAQNGINQGTKMIPLQKYLV